MRLLANENFPLDAVERLRRGGVDVAWIREIGPGMKDEQVLAMAVTESRILVTFDKDFGELAFKSKLPAHCGIVLFRIRRQSPDILVQRVAAFIAARNDWIGHFSVVEEDRIRMTGLPGNESGAIGKVGPTT
jgi:predicted nuclease of predicted toxin-antitoxin system